MPLEGSQQPAARRFPHPGGAVVAAAGHQPPIVGQRHAVDQAGVPLQCSQQATAGGVPQSDRPIRPAAGEHVAIPVERDTMRGAGVPRVSVGVRLQRGLVPGQTSSGLPRKVTGAPLTRADNDKACSRWP